jgi:hypothetical protein
MWVFVPMITMQLSELTIWLWAIIITWVSLSNQYRLNLISDFNKSTMTHSKESTYQMSLDDFSEEE